MSKKNPSPPPSLAQDGYQPLASPRQLKTEGYQPKPQGGHQPTKGSGAPSNPPNQGSSGRKK